MVLGDQSDEDLSEVNERHEEREWNHHQKQQLLVQAELADVGQHIVEIHHFGFVVVGLRGRFAGWYRRILTQVLLQEPLRLVHVHVRVVVLLHCAARLSCSTPVECSRGAVGGDTFHEQSYVIS